MALKFEQLGPYRIGKKLGRGGMGAVFEGLDTTSNTRAAVKVLAPAYSDEEGFRDRFVNEIESLYQLNHPNIVRILAWGEEVGQLYYAMELVDGTTLEAELQAGHSFDWREVTRYAIDLCKALRHAHDRGVIHRDIKPANLLLASTGEIKLSDFGIARLFGNTRLTAEGGLIGTAEYMAPEQADGGKITFHCDLYSLGCVMFALLAGRPPFQSHSLPEMLQMQRFAAPPPLSRFAPQVPDELVQIIHRLLEKEPQKRAPNAMVLGRQLAATEYGLSLFAKDEALPTDVTQVAGSDIDAAPGSADGAPHDPLGVTRALSPPTNRPQGTASAPTLAPSDVATAEKPSEASTPRDTRFITVEEEAAQRARNAQQGESISLLQAGLLIALLAGIVGGAWWLLRPPSADKLLARIETLAADENTERLLDAEDDIRSFLTRFPDDKNAERVVEFKKQIDKLRLEKRLHRQARKSLNDPNASPVQRDYLAAIALGDSDPQQAADRLQAILDLYQDPSGNDETGNDDTTAEILDLARKQLGPLRERGKQATTAQLGAIAARLKRADELQTTDPDRAAAIRRAIVQLYRDKAWAAEAVEQAQAAMAAQSAAKP